MNDTGFPFKIYAHSGEGRLINSAIHERSMEIIEVTYGKVNIRIGTELLFAVAGDFVYVPPTAVYRVDTVDGPAAVRGISFNAEIIKNHMENFDEEVFYMFDVQSKNRISVFREGHPVYPTLSHYMSESYDE